MAPRHPDRARAGSGGCAEPRDFAASRTPPAGRGGAGRERHVHTTVESFRSARPRGERAALEYLVCLRARAREGSMAPRFSGFTIQWLHGRRGSGTGPRRRDVRGAGRGGAGLRGVALDLVLEGAVLPPPALRRQWLQDSMAPRERALPLTPPCAPIPNKQTNTNTNKHKQTKPTNKTNKNQQNKQKQTKTNKTNRQSYLHAILLSESELLHLPASKISSGGSQVERLSRC